MINIDDLFKQRLGDAEEQGRPGSWLKMKDMLDEQMPVGSVAPSNLRRRLGVAALLLLLSAVTVGGGYELYSSFKGNAISEDTMVKYTSHEGNTGLAGAVVNYADAEINKPYNEFENNAQNDDNAVAANHTAVSGHTSTSATNSSSVDTHPTGVTKRNKSTIGLSSNNDDKLLTNSGLASVTKTNASINENVTPRNNSDLEKMDSRTGHKQMKGADIKTGTADLGVAKQAKPAVKTRDMKQMAMGSNAPRMNNTGNKQLPSGVENDLKIAAQTRSNNNNTKTSEDFNLDTFKKIEMRESVAKDGRVMRDTLSEGKVVVKSKKPVAEEQVETNDAALAMNNDESSDELPQEVLLNAQNAEMQTEDGEGVYTDLSKKKVSSHKMKNYNSRRFEEMVRNAKFKLDRVKFYPGIVAGVNSSMSSKNVTGFQLGFVGDITLDNKWSVLTELKYVQRFNNKIDFKEQYFANLDSSYNSGGSKVYTYDSVEHSYNFSTLSSFELPIALRYSIKKFSMFGGANVTYNLGISVDQVDLPNQISKEGNSGFRPDYGSMAGAPSIQVSDFSNRLTAGYLLGVSYNWSPAMRLDLRATQAIWDNAKTNGQEAISKDLYRVPNLQLNFSYRFGKKPYKKFR